MGFGFSSRTHVSRRFDPEHLRCKRLRQSRRESASARTKINYESDRLRDMNSEECHQCIGRVRRKRAADVVTPVYVGFLVSERSHSVDNLNRNRTKQWIDCSATPRADRDIFRIVLCLTRRIVLEPVPLRSGKLRQIHSAAGPSFPFLT